MASKRGENALLFVTQILEKGNQEMKKDDAMLKDAKKGAAEVRKVIASNVATIRRQTENFAAAATEEVNSALAVKLRSLENELEHRVSEVKDLNDALDEIDNEWNELKVQTEAAEQEVVEKSRTLSKSVKSREVARKRLSLEIELMQTVTGMYLKDGSHDIATFVGYDVKTGKPCIQTITYSENSTTDGLDNVNKTWAIIESLAGVPE